MAENERKTLKVNEELINEFIQGRLQPSIESKLVSYLQSRPDVLERLSDTNKRAVIDRMQAVQRRSGQASKDFRDSLPPSLANYPGYEVTRELGRGGIGVVYLAKNIQMDRLEVLKVLNERLLDHPGAKERFLREVRAVSKLNHPNIVTSYSILQLDKLLVFVMEYVPGVDLLQTIRTRHPLPVDQCCSFARQLAAGLQHAHSKGLVHRDIKPSNAIVYKLDNRLQLKILDFGLAKATSEEATNNLTQDGTLLGTPEYMSPEQSIDPSRADIRADIYSLGCTLYHMLAGRPPFAGSHGSVLLQHSQNMAQPVNMIRPEVPSELVAVIDKMLAKQPDKRYQTPDEVAQALLPFLQNSSRHEQLDESPRESRSRTSLDLASSTRDTSVIDVSIQSAAAAQDAGRQPLVPSQLVSVEAPSANHLRLQPLDEHRTQIRPPSSSKTAGHTDKSNSRAPQWRIWLSAIPVIALLSLGTVLLVRQLLSPRSEATQTSTAPTAVEPTGAEIATTSPTNSDTAKTNVPLEQKGDASTVASNSANADKAPTSAIASARTTTTVDKKPVAIPPELVDVDSRQATRARRAMLNEARLDDGSKQSAKLVRQLTAATWPIDRIERKSMQLDELFAAGECDPNAAPKELVAVLGNSRWKTADQLIAMDASVSGDTMVSGEINGTITVWDPANGRMRAQFKSSESDLYHVKLNRKGNRLLTSSYDGIVRMWDISPPTLVRSFVRHEGRVVSAVFSADESEIYSVDESKQLIIWDAFTATRKQTIPLPELPQESDAHPTENRLVVGCSAGKVVIVDTTQAKIIEEITLGKQRISSVDYSPDGKLLAASLDDGEVHVWLADRKYKPLRKKKVSNAPLNSIHFSPDSNVLAVGSRFECRFWDQKSDKMELRHETHDTVSDVIPLGDRWLVGWSDSHWLAMVDRSGRLLNQDTAPLTGFALTPDGTAIACTVRDAEQIRVWQLNNPPSMRVLPGQTQWDMTIGYAIHGQRIFTAGGNWFVKVWDPGKGLQPSDFKKHENWILDLDVSPDGKHVCTSGWDRTARIWDIQTGNELLKLADHGSVVPQCRYSPDGSRLTTACWDGVVRVWNTSTGALITSLPSANRKNRTSAFQPFHQNVAAQAGNDVNLYFIPDASLVRTFKGHDNFIYDLDFTIDGKRMVTSSADGTIRLWDSETGEQLQSIRLHPRRGELSRARFSYDGRHVIVLTGNGVVYLLRVGER